MKELKEFMKGVANVYEWNDRRDEAIVKFGSKLVTELDASGYIKELLNEE